MNIEEEINQTIKDINSLGFEKKMNLNAKEVATILGVSPSSIENWRKQGIGFNHIQIGGRYLFPKRALAEYIVLKTIKTI